MKGILKDHKHIVSLVSNTSSVEEIKKDLTDYFTEKYQQQIGPISIDQRGDCWLVNFEQLEKIILVRQYNTAQIARIVHHALSGKLETNLPGQNNLYCDYL